MKVTKLISFIGCICVILVSANLTGCEKKKAEDKIVLQLVDEQETEEEFSKDLLTDKEYENETMQESLKQQETWCFVHICGAVMNPGVYELPWGSRVFEVINLAGGFREDASFDYLNQASVVEDGDQITIPTVEEVENGLTELTLEVKGAETQAPEDYRININTANTSMLCTLPGVGEAKATSIINYREQQGKFVVIEDIMKVEGIKDGLFQKIKDKITI